MESAAMYILLQAMQGITEHSIEYVSDPEIDEETNEYVYPISFGTKGGSTL